LTEEERRQILLAKERKSQGIFIGVCGYLVLFIYSFSGFGKQSGFMGLASGASNPGTSSSTSSSGNADIKPTDPFGEGLVVELVGLGFARSDVSTPT
jgi:hypothetical protein